jgi:hypothetical protein
MLFDVEKNNWPRNMGRYHIFWWNLVQRNPEGPWAAPSKDQTNCSKPLVCTSWHRRRHSTPKGYQRDVRNLESVVRCAQGGDKVMCLGTLGSLFWVLGCLLGSSQERLAPPLVSTAMTCTMNKSEWGFVPKRIIAAPEYDEHKTYKFQGRQGTECARSCPLAPYRLLLGASDQDRQNTACLCMIGLVSVL